MDTLLDVFQRFKKASLTMKLNKCKFAKATIRYLGKEVGQGQVGPISAKIGAITDYPGPNTKLQLRHFLDLTGY